MNEYKPKNAEEQAIFDVAAAADRINDKRPFWIIGMFALWAGSFVVMIILPEDPVAWLAFLLGAVLCHLRSEHLRMRVRKKAAELRRLGNQYQRKKAQPLFDQITEHFPEYHVHLADDGTIQLTDPKEMQNHDK